MKTSKYRKGFALVQTLVMVTIIISIAMVGMKLVVGGRFSQAQAARRDSARAVLDGARAEAFTCLENTGPYPSPSADCVLTSAQKSCLPTKSAGYDVTVVLTKKGDTCLMQLRIDK